MEWICATMENSEAPKSTPKHGAGIKGPGNLLMEGQFSPVQHEHASRQHNLVQLSVEPGAPALRAHPNLTDVVQDVLV